MLAFFCRTFFVLAKKKVSVFAKKKSPPTFLPITNIAVLVCPLFKCNRNFWSNEPEKDSPRILVTESFSGSFDRKLQLCLNNGQTSTAMLVMGRNVGGDIFFAKTDAFFLLRQKMFDKKKLTCCFIVNHAVHALFISSFFSFLLASISTLSPM